MKITLDIPDNLMTVIRARSIKECSTMSQVVLELLEKALPATKSASADAKCPK